MRWLKRVGLTLAILAAGPVMVVGGGEVTLGGQWYSADRSRSGLAPDAESHADAVVQVYAARAFDWRGILAVHTWIATKPRGAERYTVHDVVGWRNRRGRPALASAPGTPDRTWYGNPPFLLVDLRGPEAEAVIGDIEQAVASYPFAGRYRLWPGPNSNTFTAWVARRVPELGLELPPHAIGKDYLGGGMLAAAPSGTGYQVSLYGLLGLTAAWREGIELNLLGLVFGVETTGPAVKLPGIGRLGFGEPWPRPR